MMTETPRVLLVDDMEDNLVALEAILRPLHLDLVRARSGEEAMKALLRADFALILMDVVMPGMDGFETAAHIRRLDQTRDVPIIFLTAFDRTPEYALRGCSVGAADYLTKPFDPWVLRAKVEVFVDLSCKSRPAGQARPLADVEACLDRLEATVPRLDATAAESPRSGLAETVSELADQVRDMRIAVNALVGAENVRG
jgi:CheY-like chemotaxis protein